jgi:hypothetical protein
MNNLRLRLNKLEERLYDPSGLIPHTPKWLEYWDREIYSYMMDPEGRWPAVPFPLDAVRTVMKYSDTPFRSSERFVEDPRNEFALHRTVEATGGPVHGGPDGKLPHRATEASAIGTLRTEPHRGHPAGASSQWHSVVRV